MSPLLCTQKWRHVGLPLSAQCTVMSVSPAVSIVQSQATLTNKQKMSTQCWANVSPLSTRVSQQCASDGEPTSAQYWVTVSCLAPRWMWASVTDGRPTLTQLCFKTSSWCSRYSLQCVGVRCISLLPGHCVWRWPTFKPHWGGVCYVHENPLAWSTD